MNWRNPVELKPQEFALFFWPSRNRMFIGMMGSTKEFVWDSSFPINLKKHDLYFQYLPEKPDIKKIQI